MGYFSFKKVGIIKSPLLYYIHLTNIQFELCTQGFEDKSLVDQTSFELILHHEFVLSA